MAVVLNLKKFQSTKSKTGYIFFKTIQIVFYLINDLFQKIYLYL